MNEKMQTAEKRQLIVLCDGTNNTIEARGPGTNVLQLARLLSGSSSESQLVYYDPGVGSVNGAPGATWWDKGAQALKQAWGLAFGDGVYENIAQAYSFLVNHYQEGDEIYVFGFSRGAFTARGLVGLIGQFGLLQCGQEQLVSTMLHIYFAQEGKARQLKAEKLREVAVPKYLRHIPVHFVGVWDTVQSIGMPPLDRQITTDTKLQRKDGSAKCFKHVRQALALDEHRAPFAPRIYSEKNTADNGLGQSLKQVWFPGVHLDVGGVYLNEKDGRPKDESAEVSRSAMSVAAMNWLVNEAIHVGLRMKQTPEPLLQLPSKDRILHDELYRRPIWAVAGMSVRRAEFGQALTDQELPGLSKLCFPEDTVWSRDSAMDALRQPRSFGLLLLSALAIFVCWVCMASALQNKGLVQLMLSPVTEVFNLPVLWQTTLDWVMWQLKAVVHVSAGMPHPEFGYVKTALFFDMLMIAAYAYFLSRILSRCFVSIALLNRLNEYAGFKRKILNFLGRGLQLLVIADVVENLCYLIYVWTQGHVWTAISWLLSVMISISCALIFIASAMCAALVIWGWFCMAKTNHQ